MKVTVELTKRVVVDLDVENLQQVREEVFKRNDNGETYDGAWDRAEVVDIRVMGWDE